MSGLSQKNRLAPAAAAATLKGPRYVLSTVARVALQEFLCARQLIRDDRLDREQEETRHHQIPPQALAPLGLFAGHFLRRGAPVQPGVPAVLMPAAIVRVGRLFEG